MNSLMSELQGGSCTNQLNLFKIIALLINSKPHITIN